MLRCTLTAHILAPCLWLSGSSTIASTAPACPIGSAETFTCYPPSQASKVERLLPVRPIDPTPAVAAVTGLPLTLVMAEKRLLPRPSMHPIALTFVYGPAPTDGVIPYPPLPPWMFVSEAVGHVKGLRGIHWGRDSTGALEYWANLPNHRLNLCFESNQSRATIRCVVLELLQEARRKELPVAGPVPSVECLLLGRRITTQTR